MTNNNTLMRRGTRALVQPDRYRTFLFGVDYYPEQWVESEWIQDAEMMRACRVNAIRVGEFAWYLMEPAEGTFNFDLFDRAIEIFAKFGIKTILGTPTSTPPKWLTAKYPEVLHVYSNGQPGDDQSRRHCCLNSERYRDLSRKIAEAMVRHFEDNPNVIGWQVDNELNNENKNCFSNGCRIAFRRWLQQKYRTLEELNIRWGTEVWSQWYADWDEVDLPWPTLAIHNPALMLEWKRFISASATSYLEEQVAIIRKYRPGDFITANGAFKNINYYRFTRNLDIYAHDNYPTFMEVPQYAIGAALTTCRGFNGRMMMMEQLTGPAGQTYLLRTPQPGQMRLWAFQTIAHGADGVVHFRWRAARRGAEQYWFGVLDHDSVPRGRFHEFRTEGLELAMIGAEIMGSTLESDIAVIKDFDAEWVFDHQYFTDEVNIGVEFVNFFQAASEMKYNIDIVGLDAEFNKYKVIFGPHLILMDPELAEKIRCFVEQGGTFVISAHSAVKDRDNAMTDGTIPILVADLFGVDLDVFQCYQPPSRGKNAVRFEDGTAVPVNVFADVLKTNGAKVIGTWECDFMKHAPACTENALGKGKAVYYGSFFNLDSARYLIGKYAAEQKLGSLCAGFPKEVEVTRRTKGSINYYFILNHAGESVTINPGSGYFDMIEGKPAPSSIRLMAYQYKVLKKEPDAGKQRLDRSPRGRRKTVV